MAKDSKPVPTGRLRRLAHLAAMGPRAGVALARDAVARDRGERLGEVRRRSPSSACGPSTTTP